MKKILPLLLLSFVLVLPGCRPSPTYNCTRTGLIPGSSYMVIVDLGGGQTQTFMRAADSNGTIAYTIKVPCSNVMAVIRVTFSNLSLSAGPSSINLLSPPSTVTITGDLFDTTYGMPRVEYFDDDGYLVGSVYATSVSGGTSLTANVPDLSSAYSGSYQIRVTNKTYEGYYAHSVGTANVSAYGRDRWDSDGDGWYDDEDCDPYDPYRSTYCGGCIEDPMAIICDPQ